MHPFKNIKTIFALPLLLLGVLSITTAKAQPAEPQVALRSSVPIRTALHGARPLGRLASSQTISLALTLPLRNQTQLTELLQKLYDPKSPLRGHYLTPPQFAEKFGPAPASYAAVAAYVKAQGLTITHTYPSRTVLDVAGSVGAVEKAFGVRLQTYKLPSGQIVYANGSAPLVPRRLAAQIAGIAGLNNLSLLARPHFRRQSPQALIPLAQNGKIESPQATAPAPIGTGPVGGLAPADIKKAYNLDATSLGTTMLDGTGQSLALYELDGYALTDVTAYVTQFMLTAPNLTNVLVDQFTGAPQSADGQTEVTLDIDMMVALAPNADNIYVYEGMNGTTATLDIYTQIASDDLASEVSSSWGVPELQVDAATRDAENVAFQQMAAQGQSFFAAAGDFGAYDDYDPTKPLLGATLSVDDPASQPYTTGVGGTRLSLTAVDPKMPVSPSYVSETTWNTSPLDSAGGPAGGGGGISEVWAKPSYQTGLGSSPTDRDVPDVSLNADPNTGYDIFVAADDSTAFITVGGTSAASPLWAAFTALVNQQRTTNGLSALGFANPSLYAIGRSANYATDFHDIADGSTNLYYAAEPGYDDATGLGSFIGNQLLAALSSNPDQGGPVGTISGTVTDASTGLPIVGATVTATSTTTGTTKGTSTTDGGGNYTLSVPSGLALTLSVDTSAVTGTTAYAGQTVSIPASGVGALTAGGTLSLSFALNAAQTFGAGLQMISAPYDYSAAGDFATLFGLALPLQSTDPRLIIWQPAQNSYVFYPNPPADTLHLGLGYWVRFPAATYIHRDGIPVSTASYQIALQAGWNQIGDPYTGAAPLSGITAQATSGGTAAPLAASAAVSPTLYRYDQPSNAYVTLSPATDSLQPFAGYWIFANVPATLTVPSPIPPPP